MNASKQPGERGPDRHLEFTSFRRTVMESRTARAPARPRCGHGRPTAGGVNSPIGTGMVPPRPSPLNQEPPARGGPAARSFSGDSRLDRVADRAEDLADLAAQED